MKILCDSKPVLDLKVISQLQHIDSAGNHKLLNRLLSYYYQFAPRVLAEIHEDLAGGNFEHLRYLAHQFKTTNANLGLLRMSEILQQLEDEELGHKDRSDLVSYLDLEIIKAFSALRNIENTDS